MKTQSLLTESEAGDKLRMLPTRVLRLARAGEMPCVILPDGELRFDAVDLDAWIEQHKRPIKAQDEVTHANK